MINQGKAGQPQVGKKTSTGGQTFTTPTGKINKANPNNPNMQAQQGGGPAQAQAVPQQQAPQLGNAQEPAQQAAPNFAQTNKNAGYASTQYNVPTGVPQVGGAAPQATTAPQPGETQPQARPALTPDQQKQQAATKAKMQGQRAAGKSMATSTGPGMQNAVDAARAQGIATAESVQFGDILWKQLQESRVR
jgi:hypothetical protein